MKDRYSLNSGLGGTLLTEMMQRSTNNFPCKAPNRIGGYEGFGRGTEIPVQGGTGNKKNGVRGQGKAGDRQKR